MTMIFGLLMIAAGAWMSYRSGARRTLRGSTVPRRMEDKGLHLGGTILVLLGLGLLLASWAMRH